MNVFRNTFQSGECRTFLIFAMRKMCISDRPEMQRVYDLTLQLKEPRNVKGMIDLMEHLPEVCVVNGIQNERQLGEFLVCLLYTS